VKIVRFKDSSGYCLSLSHSLSWCSCIIDFDWHMNPCVMSRWGDSLKVRGMSSMIVDTILLLYTYIISYKFPRVLLLGSYGYDSSSFDFYPIFSSLWTALGVVIQSPLGIMMSVIFVIRGLLHTSSWINSLYWMWHLPIPDSKNSHQTPLTFLPCRWFWAWFLIHVIPEHLPLAAKFFDYKISI